MDKWCILYEDDASRFITGYGKFKRKTSDNAWKAFERGLKFGIPKQLHSDNDSTFRSNEQKGKKKGECDFEKKVRGVGVHQIFARVKRPQANGKLERLISTIKKLWIELGSLEKEEAWRKQLNITITRDPI